MEKINYIIACSKVWDSQLLNRLQQTLSSTSALILMTECNELTLEVLKSLNPRYIFFPHWSYLIPEAIFQRYECVVFHMTDLPFGRGGSPLQNLIARGIYETKVSALRCVKDLDAGPIYMKVPLSLQGSAQEIYYRATQAIEKMIVQMIQGAPKPVDQEGDSVVFKRRTPEQSRLEKLPGLQQVFDHIRMLDAESYPKAFLEVEGYRYEFSRASFDGQKILADVVITKVEHDKK